MTNSATAIANISRSVTPLGNRDDNAEVIFDCPIRRLYCKILAQRTLYGTLLILRLRDLSSLCRIGIHVKFRRMTGRLKKGEYCRFMANLYESGRVCCRCDLDGFQYFVLLVLYHQVSPEEFHCLTFSHSQSKLSVKKQIGVLKLRHC
jgi:hypothetical protein